MNAKRGIKRIRNHKKRIRPVLALLASLLILLLVGCSSSPTTETTKELPYHQISQEEAQEMMAKDGALVIVDVRTQEEYDSGHIPGAICIPVESIGTEQPAELPDLDQTLLIYCRSGRRSKEASVKLADIGYTNIYEFGGINTWIGETTAAVAEETLSEDDMAEAMMPVPQLVVEVNGKTFYPSLEENSSTATLVEKLSTGPVTIDMHDYNNFEKVGPLPWELPTNDEEITTKPGDIILYQGDQITIYYDENSWSLTKLGNIGNVTKEELLELFGSGNVKVTFWVEWSE